LGDEGLPETQSASKKEAKHSIKKTVASQSDEDERGHLESDIESHHGCSPKSQGQTVKPASQSDGQEAKSNVFRTGIFDPLSKVIRCSAKKR
jgi:hypothetical protein